MLRKLGTVLAALGLLVSTWAWTSSTIAASCAKLPALADISAMDVSEQAVHANRGCNQQLVSYTKLFIPFGADGRPGTPVYLAGDRPIASIGKFVPLDPPVLDASGTDSHGLYLSLGVMRNTGTGWCVDYDFNGYFSWTNGQPDGPNTGYDFWGITWAGGTANDLGPAAYSYDQWGTMLRHDLASTINNGGYVMRFYEMTEWARSQTRGYFYTGTHQSACNGLYQNLSLQYTHTFASTSYSVTVAPVPGFSVAPSTDQWQFSVPSQFKS